jgi:AraC-like DNA-binding protein/mannose-6-phosphate isomerase-like protein (cupin superfamily)
MDLLIDSSYSDRISEFLRVFRVRSTIYCHSAMSSPWGFRVKGSTSASFHLLLSGRAWLEVNGGEPTRLSAGDLVVLPHGDDHQLRDNLTSDIEFLDDILKRTPPEGGHIRYGGGGTESEIICGGFVIEDPELAPPLPDLPPVLHSPLEESETASFAASASAMLAALTDERAPARAALANRLAEVLLTQAIGEHATRSPGESWLSAISEPSIAAALKMIHHEPGYGWTVDRLARRVGMSRSIFSERFRRVTGDPPMSYVRKCRLGRAARYLTSTNWGLAYIARRTGYESDVALSKAFKKQFGTSPREYRNAVQEALDPDAVRGRLSQGD